MPVVAVVLFFSAEASPACSPAHLSLSLSLSPSPHLRLPIPLALDSRRPLTGQAAAGLCFCLLCSSFTGRFMFTQRAFSRRKKRFHLTKLQLELLVL